MAPADSNRQPTANVNLNRSRQRSDRREQLTDALARAPHNTFQRNFFHCATTTQWCERGSRCLCHARRRRVKPTCFHMCTPLDVMLMPESGSNSVFSCGRQTGTGRRRMSHKTGRKCRQTSPANQPRILHKILARTLKWGPRHRAGRGTAYVLGLRGVGVPGVLGLHVDGHRVRRVVGVLHRRQLEQPATHNNGVNKDTQELAAGRNGAARPTGTER